MKQEQGKTAQWPEFAAPLLQEVAAAFQRRGKAIRYQAELLCSREFSETDAGALERLNLNLRSLTNDLRLSVWADGVIWVRLCVPGPGPNAGWAFLEQFHGSIQDVSPEVLVALIEATITEPFRPGGSDPAEYRERLRTLWRRVRPWTE